MTAIDWAIVLLALVLAPLGYRQGFVVGALTLAGFAGGAFAGARVGPLLLAEGSQSPYAPLMALLGGLILGAILAVVAEGIGHELRQRLVRGGALRGLDAVGGAGVLIVLALAISWVIGAVALNAPALQDYRRDIQRSTILSSLNEILPPSGPLLNVLNRIDPTPRIDGPSADVGRPRPRLLNDPDFETASGSVVQILGTACGLNVAGSGWVAAPERVVTNAHVVAGQGSSTVRTRDGTELEGIAVAYRPRNDVAVLSVSGLGLAPIPLAAEPEAGTLGGVAGFPAGGGFTAAPARLGSTGTVRSQDSYGRGPVERRMTSFRGEVVGGNSGGPVIDGEGQVLTTVFAASVGASRPEGLGVPNEVTGRVLDAADGPVGTGPCAR